MVVKALSWALRELARKELVAFREFLRRNENQLAVALAANAR
jgi:hypothetical protein